MMQHYSDSLNGYAEQPEEANAEHYGWLLIRFAQQAELLYSDSPLGNAIRCLYAWQRCGYGVEGFSSPSDILSLQRKVFILQQIDAMSHYEDRRNAEVGVADLANATGVSVDVCAQGVRCLLSFGLVVRCKKNRSVFSCSAAGASFLYYLEHPTVLKLN